MGPLLLAFTRRLIIIFSKNKCRILQRERDFLKRHARREQGSLLLLVQFFTYFFLNPAL
jgi:hypothetical protein